MGTAIVMDLVAEVVASGASPARAVAAVGHAVGALDPQTARALLALSTRLSVGHPVAVTGAPVGPGERVQAEVPGVAGALEQALGLAVVSGASPVGLIRAAAQDRRRRQAAVQVQAARRLAVLVLLPTGLCLLPAFVLLTIVPLVIDLVLG
jgi:tight adherence protein B